VPGSSDCCSASSKTAIDIAIDTGTDAAASTSNGRSRRRSVPFVRMEKGAALRQGSDDPGMSA
jgi:hypothetical protein